MSVPIAKRRVVYHGVQSELWSNIKRDSKVFEKYGVQPRKYFLFVSTMYQYKHPEVLLLAFARIRALGSYVDQRILLVGEFQDRRVESYLTKMIVETGMEDIARVTGGVPIAELGCLYEGCTAFVMPTTMETFGHMYLEAMSAGAPVICADMPFAREVCGEAAWYFAPMDDEGCARLMLRSMKDDDGTAILRAAGAMQTRKYSWRREATETLELLRQLAR